MANSNRQSRKREPDPIISRKQAAGVPADFPLHIHGSGRWAKKVRGKRHYFGKVSEDPKGEAALLLWLDQKDDLYAGRVPRSKSGGLTVLDLCTSFLTAKKSLLDSEEIVLRTFRDYKDICKRLVKHFGDSRLVEDLKTEDFDSFRAAATKKGEHIHVSNMVQRTRTVFKFAYDAGLIEGPIRFGPTFKKPSRKALRLAKSKQPKKLYSRKEILKLLDAADVQLRAMILLGINAAFGNNDCGTLPISALDLDNGWINYARPKTAIDRRVRLWRETVAAIQESLEKRPQPKQPEAQDLVFVTKYGKPWAKKTEDSPITKEFRKVVDETKLHQERRGFYSLRHTHETIAGGCKDQVAVNAVMGHVDDSMAAAYREGIDDSRLVDESEFVRKWLFEDEDKVTDQSKTKPKPKTKRPSRQSVSAATRTDRPLLRIVG